MATPLGNKFSTAENQVSQCGDQTLGSTAETLVINFDQEKLEQLLIGGSKSPLHLRQNRKISVAKVFLATSGKQVSIETTEVLRELNTTSRKAKRALREPITVLTGTKLAPRQHTSIAREPSKVPCEICVYLGSFWPSSISKKRIEIYIYSTHLLEYLLLNKFRNMLQTQYHSKI